MIFVFLKPAYWDILNYVKNIWVKYYQKLCFFICLISVYWGYSKIILLVKYHSKLKYTANLVAPINFPDRKDKDKSCFRWNPSIRRQDMDFKVPVPTITSSFKIGRGYDQ